MDCRPSALRVSDSTITIRVKLVTIIKRAGATASSVNAMMMVTLSLGLLRALPRLMRTWPLGVTAVAVPGAPGATGVAGVAGAGGAAGCAGTAAVPVAVGAGGFGAAWAGRAEIISAPMETRAAASTARRTIGCRLVTEAPGTERLRGATYEWCAPAAARAGSSMADWGECRPPKAPSIGPPVR